MAIPEARIATMREWKLNRPDALDVKLADVMADIDGAMLRIFDHFGFPADRCQAALEVARAEDIRRMDHAAIAERPQIDSRTFSNPTESQTLDHLGNLGLARRDCGLVAVEIRTSREG
jgi:hypothetical protein